MSDVNLDGADPIRQAPFAQIKNALEAGRELPARLLESVRIVDGVKSPVTPTQEWIAMTIDSARVEAWVNHKQLRHRNHAVFSKR